MYPLTPISTNVHEQLSDFCEMFAGCLCCFRQSRSIKKQRGQVISRGRNKQQWCLFLSVDNLSVKGTKSLLIFWGEMALFILFRLSAPFLRRQCVKHFSLKCMQQLISCLHIQGCCQQQAYQDQVLSPWNPPDSSNSSDHLQLLCWHCIYQTYAMVTQKQINLHVSVKSLIFGGSVM